MSLEHQRNAISIFLPYLKEDSTQVYKSVLLCGIPMKWKTKATSVESFTKKGKKKASGGTKYSEHSHKSCPRLSKKMFLGDVLESREKKKTDRKTVE